jgi:predicted amidohydrolase YtcJ
MALQNAGVSPAERPILTHCQILGADLIETMREQGVIGNIQPSFTITDSAFAKKRLPEHMLPFSYCWKKMLDAGVVCAGGSDAPIETCNPFQGMYDAIFRCKPSEPQDVFLPEERLSFEEALRMYTKNGAFACKEEHRLGELRKEFEADFVVLQYDVTQDPQKLLASDLVKSVWVAGKKRFEPDFSSESASSSNDFRNSLLPGKNGCSTARIRLCHCCRS